MSAPPVRRALITGVAGQDGSYLAELLCAEGLDVHGVVRDARSASAANLDAVRDQLTLHTGDLHRAGTLRAIVAATDPDEVYHLAAPAFVPRSWTAVEETMRAITTVTGELIDAVRDITPSAHVVLASSREIFSASAPSPWREDSPCAPGTPYGVAKLAAHQLAGLVRAHDDLHVSSAILFNHESPRRPADYVTRKVTRAAAAISAGRCQRLTLGDLDAVRDWSAAVEVVRALRLMAAASRGGDYVLASGVGRTVRRLVDVAFACVGLDGAAHIDVDPALVRPREEADPVGEPTRARAELGWEPRMTFEEMIEEMVAADVAALRDGDR